MKFRKKPVVIEAMQWNADNAVSVMNFCPRATISRVPPNGEIQFYQDLVIIRTLEGDMIAQRGDWIIKGVKGEFYPCKPDIFAATYEAVEEPRADQVGGVAHP